MKMFKKLLIAFLVLGHSSFGQDLRGGPDQLTPYIGKIEPKHTVNMVIGLPNNAINKPFSSTLRAIIDLNPYYQYHLPNGISFGVGGRFIHFAVNEFRTPERLDGVVNSYGGFGKVGYEKFYTDRFAMDFSVKVGYLYTTMKTDLNRLYRNGPYEFDCGFVEPSVSFILSATEKSSYRLTMGYTILAYKFSPYHLGTLMDGGWDKSEYDRLSQLFTFGLGYTYYLGK